METRHSSIGPAALGTDHGAAMPTALEEAATPSAATPAIEHPPVFSPLLHGPLRWTAELLSTLYLGLIAAIATLGHLPYVFFPELGALAHDVFTRPRGPWASAPLYLALTPVITALLGTLIANALPFGYLSMLLIVALSIAVVQALRSPIAPAISAGALPLVMELKSAWYAPAILLGTGLLALLTWAWRAYCLPRMPRLPATKTDVADNEVELCPTRAAWIPALVLIIVAGVALVQLTGLRLILFPPVIVVAFEMFGHPSVCPWARKPVRLVIACTVAAAGGLAAVMFLGTGVLSTVLGMAFAIGVLRVLDLRVPPALAVAVIPQIMEHPAWTYPLAIASGTLLITVVFLPYRWLLLRQARAQASGMMKC